jgi:hypothetical protein
VSNVLQGHAGSNLALLRKTFGSIPDVEVGTWWPTRQDIIFINTPILDIFLDCREGCSTDAIHACVQLIRHKYVMP